jgi:hypothetical protein
LLVFFALFFFAPPFFAAMDLFSLPFSWIRNGALLQLFDCIELFKNEVKRKIPGTTYRTLHAPLSSPARSSSGCASDGGGVIVPCVLRGRGVII